MDENTTWEEFEDLVETDPMAAMLYTSLAFASSLTQDLALLGRSMIASPEDLYYKLIINVWERFHEYTDTTPNAE